METMQKQIANRLDRAANAAQEFGATSKQCWYLASLLAAAGETADSVFYLGEKLTKRLASTMISELKSAN